MDQIAHPLMSPHVPSFITRPGETDTLLVIVGVFLLLLIVGLGVVYFRLHALPEQISHRGNSKAQFEIVAVLALLALFTHNNAFWVAALILAMIPLPDFMTPLDNDGGGADRHGAQPLGPDLAGPGRRTATAACANARA